MRAYKGVVENEVVVLIGAKLPEGTVVTVTVGEGELLRAKISSALNRPKKIRIKLRPMPGLTSERVPNEAEGHVPEPV